MFRIFNISWLENRFTLKYPKINSNYNVLSTVGLFLVYGKHDRVRSAPTTFHTVGVDDFTSIVWDTLYIAASVKATAAETHLNPKTLIIPTWRVTDEEEEEVEGGSVVINSRPNHLNYLGADCPVSL
jgi:hypothetical protein